MYYRITHVDVVRYPVVRVVFDDGFSGEYDMTDLVTNGPIFAPLKDPAYFAKVAIGEYGRSFGWNLDDIGHEIDFCPDATRITLETQAARKLASEFENRLSAAE